MVSGEHDDERDDAHYRDPLPPDDRLWRHPSELDDIPAPRRSARVAKFLSSLLSRQRP